MTTELEKQFFDTFGIEPKKVTIWNAFPCYTCEEYPQITDKQYLEMIYFQLMLNRKLEANIDWLKTRILKDCIRLAEDETFKHQVQSIFKE